MLNFHRTLTALRDKKKSDEGFTLIELLVVVLIIGVLAAIAIPIFLTQQTQAENAGKKADLANAKIAYVSAVVSGKATPTTADLTDNGYTGGPVTIFAGSGSKHFCIQSGDFKVTAAGGVSDGACAAADLLL